MTAHRVGVVALQGGVREHMELLGSLGASAVPLRRPEDLLGPDGLRVDAVVLPGGESSTIDRLLKLFGLGEPLKTAIADGLPTLGTCAGLIQLSSGIEDPAPGQESFGVLDVTVRRNAFGRQVDSAETCVDTPWGPAQVAFIRAPEVVSYGPSVTPLGRLHDRLVAVNQGSITGIAFHPELTGETLFHRRLLESIS
ncbi:MAG TPA: pyridoxal 5'-phosphate synthase glutaminase subunit PdxT [Propionibacteriaceae bacterium]|nr:pyridoxal 5'-phosphate synthase glutaminase subunit PdxT [Propionibacteriaceae bacterium]